LINFKIVDKKFQKHTFFNKKIKLNGNNGPAQSPIGQPGPAQFLYGSNGLGPKKPECIFGLVFLGPTQKYGLLARLVSPAHF